ncbi:cAMP and cAMP-inhibited cGMP 3',5'-cyclic phosphodiesterase 10A isoform X2 [Nilaparvata lugens]|uniref:cAMP and cAMP-inhibited cGMP 3',5'-cyclic phosphodiesterase 10A isoform X1 n=1 Tax=Nilaparvata lugens TaxID=108931 RepID=UPI00193DD090|nr:cAMP and cAMP-inhibited cGMP 3',5'-cyclic phosphodiesterase 10A isoform X1 [Nilaparvata lugens]XP_039289175.1 cAMP and cAMP-inhibited cGMP 3',5'-cyclic phosphodiesterase 10A isoform X2 [Nilaparvata lugens]
MQEMDMKHHENNLLRPTRTEGESPSLSKNKFKESYSLAHLTSDKESRRAIAPYLRTFRRTQKESTFGTSLDYAYAKAVAFYIDEDSNLMKALEIFTAQQNIIIPGSIQETAELLRELTHSAAVSLYTVDNVNGELYLLPQYNDSYRHRVNEKIGLNTTVACHVAFTKKHVWIGDILADSRFPNGIGWSGMDIPVKAVICAPILTTEDEVSYIIELYRKVDAPNYTKNDAQLVVTMTAWMGAAIFQNQLRLHILRQQKLNSRLLEFINTYFGDPSGNEVRIISDMMLYARRMLFAEESSFFIMNQRSAQTFEADWYSSGVNDCNEMFRRKSKCLKLDETSAIAAYVAKAKEMVNIKDLKSDERFKDLNASKSRASNEIRTALAAPLLSYGKVSGVIIITNKKFHGHFDETDENIFYYFASYSSLAMHHYGVYKELAKSKYQNEVDKEILKYHLRANGQEEEKLENSTACMQLPDNFFHFQWYPFNEHIAKMDEYMLCLLQSVLGDKYMRENNFPKFIAMAKKCYRNIHYHNFQHAFAVTHGMTYILHKNRELFNGLELKALMVACIIHDIDHRAHTNSFLYNTNHSLAKLYPASALENHHFYLGSMLIKECNLFTYLSKEIYHQLMKEIEVDVLHTDLATHFQSRTRLAGIIQEHNFNWQNQSHRFLMKGIMMTTCDLIGQTKPLPIAEKIATSLYREFYSQGDEEKDMGLTPLPAMDRERAFMIPDDQVKFISIAVIPCNELLTAILPNTEDILNSSIALRDSWQELIDMGNKNVWRPEDSLVKKKYYE